MTLGSLFDGSGGFPLAGVINGITPVWASEIEPYPIKVTSARFPYMKQYGDIVNMDGSKIEPVDIITFGSPCQDLSIGGSRQGLQDGSRSSLFFHAIRIIKEMRNETNGKYPKYVVWENVLGSFSSNKRRDFATVLESFASISQGEIHVPVPKKWEHAGLLDGNGWSVAWRVYNAEYWGVPQHRERVFLIACLGNECAGEILFKSEGLLGDFKQSAEQRENLSKSIDGNFGISSNGSLCLIQNDKTGVISNSLNQHVLCIGNGQTNQSISDKVSALNCMHDQQIILYDMSHACDALRMYEGVSPTLNCRMGTGGNQIPLTEQKINNHYVLRRLTPLECCRLQGFPDWWEDGVSGSDTARYKMWGNGIALPCAVDVLKRIAIFDSYL